MSECTQEYLVLFNNVTDAIRTLEQVVYRLKTAQQIAEELYIALPEEQ